MQATKTEAIMSRLKAGINSGKYAYGSSLPSERELAELHMASRVTVRAALARLTKEGVIDKIKGRGSFVRLGGEAESRRKSILSSTIHMLYKPCHWPNLEDMFTLSLIKEMSPLLARSGKGLRLVPVLLGGGLGDFLSKCLARDLVGGVIVSTLDLPVSDGELRQLRDLGIPCASLGRFEGDTTIPFVESDHRVGAHMAVRHLMEHGHKRIAFLGGPLKGFSMGASQIEGYRQAMAEAGMAVRKGWEIDVPMWDGRAAFDACERWLDGGASCTAVVASGGEAAAGMMRSFGRRGIKVPDDVAVVMYSDFPWLRQLFPMPMSAVRESIAALAWNLVDLLDCVREGKAGYGSCRILTPELARRRSCGCSYSSDWEAHCMEGVS